MHFVFNWERKIVNYRILNNIKNILKNTEIRTAIKYAHLYSIFLLKYYASRWRLLYHVDHYKMYRSISKYQMKNIKRMNNIITMKTDYQNKYFECLSIPSRYESTSSTHLLFGTANNSSDRENPIKEAVSSSSTQSLEIPNP